MSGPTSGLTTPFSDLVWLQLPRKDADHNDVLSLAFPAPGTFATHLKEFDMRFMCERE